MPGPAAKISANLWCPYCGEEKLSKRGEKAGSGKNRYSCKACTRRTTNPQKQPPQILPKAKIGRIKKNKLFVITSAVNDTPIVPEAHETFRRVAEEHGGQYLVIPTVYQNPDLYHQGVTANYRWPDEILPYVCNVDFKLNESIHIRANTRIRHTAINPLAGLNHAGDRRSEIYGHPQVAMELVATPKNYLPKMMHTTGTISQRNYGGSTQAKKAEFHHSVSAVLIEVEGDKFWARQLHFDGRGCYDLDRYYTPTETTDGHNVSAIVYGDVHVRSLKSRVETLISCADALLLPEKRILHDLHDQHIGSHHNAGNVIFGLRKAKEGEFSVRDELMMAVKYLEVRPGAYVVDSNHHRHLDQWFNRFQPKNDILNAPLYFELGELVRADIERGGDGNAFRCFVEKYCKASVKFIGPNDDFDVSGIDCSQHGDIGPNGARGSAKAFSRSGRKTFVGHSHTPRIEKGSYQVGVMSPDLEYAAGFSSWMNTHGIIYKNGKRALFSIVQDRLAPSMRPGYWEKRL